MARLIPESPERPPGRHIQFKDGIAGDVAMLNCALYFCFRLKNGLLVKVDYDDLEIVSQYSWFYSPRNGGNSYVAREEFVSKYPRRRKTYRLHREIMQPPDGMVVDHINGDGLDNRKCNLRICTHGQNAANQVHRKQKGNTPYNGVYKRFEAGSQRKYRAQFGRKYLGCFYTADEAAEAVNKAAYDKYGEFARLNIIPAPEISR